MKSTLKLSLLFTLFFWSNYLYGQQYQISSSVLGNGGDFISGSNFQINSTAGQILVGFTEAGNFKKQVGFWRPAQILTPVEELNNIIPSEYGLEQNYPNPFNPSTTIVYQIPEESNVLLKIYDLLGSEIIILENGVKAAGKYKINYNAVNLSSGIYFYVLDTRSKISNKHYTKVRKMILLK